MSQNLDATAIKRVKSMPLFLLRVLMKLSVRLVPNAVALPENFRIHDLEKFNLNRFRFRGALSTASIDDFTRFLKILPMKAPAELYRC